MTSKIIRNANGTMKEIISRKMENDVLCSNVATKGPSRKKKIIVDI